MFIGPVIAVCASGPLNQLPVIISERFAYKIELVFSFLLNLILFHQYSTVDILILFDTEIYFSIDFFYWCHRLHCTTLRKPFRFHFLFLGNAISFWTHSVWSTTMTTTSTIFFFSSFNLLNLKYRSSLCSKLIISMFSSWIQIATTNSSTVNI